MIPRAHRRRRIVARYAPAFTTKCGGHGIQAVQTPAPPARAFEKFRPSISKRHAYGCGQPTNTYSEMPDLWSNTNPALGFHSPLSISPTCLYIAKPRIWASPEARCTTLPFTM